MSGASDPKSKGSDEEQLNEQIADVIFKWLKPGGVTVGGLAGLGLLFTQSDIPKAIASFGIGVGISYGAKVLQPIHKSNEERFKQAGEQIDKKIDQALVRASGLEGKYLQCQMWACQAYRSEGIAQHEGIFTPLLEEVFVPLQLDGSSLPAGFKALAPENLSTQQDASVNQFDIWDLLRRTTKEPTLRQLAILAWGGYGKTTLLKHVAFIYAQREQSPFEIPDRIPVLLILRKYRDLITQTEPLSLVELITQEHVPSLPGSADLEVPEDWMRDQLKQGNVVVMLDGFDEVETEKRPAVAKWINDEMRHYNKSVFIVTSRPKAYRDQAPANRLEMSNQLWVRDFKEPQRRRFVERWYECQERYAQGGRDTPDVKQLAKEASTGLLKQIEGQAELKSLAKNPLLLNMIVRLHRRDPRAKLPARRVKLYEEICKLQLLDRPGARELRTILTDCEGQIILQALALKMMERHQERIERSDLLKLLKQYLTEQEEQIDPKIFLEQVVQISELLVEQEDEYEFAHLSFQEYLAARQICDLPQERETLLYSHLSKDWWKQTILLYVAQAKKPAALIQAALNQGLNDLAYQCLQETSKQVDPTLVAKVDSKLAAEVEDIQQAVTSSRYQQLETYLKSGQWQEADKETYRLMITTVGKEEGQWFDIDELLNFPCEELKELDRLWVKYSEGRFGFSVQKKLYLECGGFPDGKYHDKAWRKLCQTNGWQDREGNYVGANYSISALRGHLPFDWIVVGYWGVGVSSIFISHRDL